MKKLLLVLSVIIIGLVLFIIYGNNPTINVGGEAYHSYYTSTNSSSSIPMIAATTTYIFDTDASRVNALVCNLSAANVYLFQMPNNSTTTGIRLYEGVPLFASSTGNNCREFPGFRGYLYGIAEVTSTVTVSEWK